MCGIAGFSGSTPEPQKTLSAMLGSIVHRGPDDDGMLVEGRVAMGMRRLSIIDVAHGKQPVTTPDGRYSIVFNGEIYNHQEVRAALEAQGGTFRTQSDTEVILIGYAMWGADILAHLRGMFAFAIYDHQAQSLFIARDRIGIKPLYYAVKEGVFVFASEIKAMLEHPRITRTPNLTAVDAYLSLRYSPGPQTLFEGIEKFPPAHFMVWEDGQPPRWKRYWQGGDVLPFKGSFSDAQDVFAACFDEVTRMHMISERPVGAFLSGGLDSTAIVTSLVKQVPSTLKTFSVGFNWKGDELSIAAQTARTLGCDHHEIQCQAEDTRLLGRVTYHLDEPVGDGIILPMYLLSRLAGERVRVVQSGEGADEILGGYFMHKVMRWAALYARYVPALIRKGAILPLVEAIPASLLNLAFDYPGDLGEAGKKRLIGFLKMLGASSSAAQYDYVISLFSEEDKRTLYASSFAAQLGSVHAEDEGSAVEAFNDILKLQFAHWLPDDILCKLDKITMAHSLEGRVPFMDHKLVELAFSFPAAYKLGLRQNKRVLRAYLAQNGNTPMAARRKVPFYIPIDQYLAAQPLKGMVDELLSDVSLRRRGLFDPAAVARLKKQAGESGFLFGKQIFALAMLELWYRLYIDREQGWLE